MFYNLDYIITKMKCFNRLIQCRYVGCLRYPKILICSKCSMCSMCSLYQCIQWVHSIYIFYNLAYRLPKWNAFIDWFNVGIQHVNIKYVLHHVLQCFNVYSMSIQWVFNEYSMSIQYTYIQCSMYLYLIYIYTFNVSHIFYEVNDSYLLPL